MSLERPSRARIDHMADRNLKPSPGLLERRKRLAQHGRLVQLGKDPLHERDAAIVLEELEQHGFGVPADLSLDRAKRR